MSSDLAGSIGRELAHELDDALNRIRHCLDQLTDEQVWWRPAAQLPLHADAMNSIGNLLLHLGGNVGQWLISGLGGIPDARNRPAEFAQREPISKEELSRRLEGTVGEARAILRQQKAEDWMRVRRVQGFEVTGLGAAINSVAHFRGHTQEIVHLTRTILGERYRFAWIPTTPEQGAP